MARVERLQIDEMSPDGKIFCGLTLEQVEACLAKQKAVQS